MSTIIKSNTNKPSTHCLIDRSWQVFAGTSEHGTKVVNAVIEGTGYLTYNIVSNSTYNVDACLFFCTSIPRCSKFEILISYLPPLIILCLLKHLPTSHFYPDNTSCQLLMYTFSRPSRLFESLWSTFEIKMSWSSRFRAPWPFSSLSTLLHQQILWTSGVFSGCISLHRSAQSVYSFFSWLQMSSQICAANCS